MMMRLAREYGSQERQGVSDSLVGRPVPNLSPLVYAPKKAEEVGEHREEHHGGEEGC